MQSADHADLVDALYAGRLAGKPGVDLSRFHFTPDDALRLQLAVLDRYESSGDQLAGWKVSFTSGGARDRMGHGYRPFGYITKSRSLIAPAQVALAAMANTQIEPELCLELGSPLSGAVSYEQARSAVTSVRPSFELNEFRAAPTADAATVLADGSAQWGLVTGDGVAPLDADLCSTAVTLWEDDVLVSSVVPYETMDDPYVSLARLSEMLGRYGRTLSPGDLVITGAFCKAAVTGPGLWRAEFAGVGDVSVTFVTGA